MLVDLLAWTALQGKAFMSSPTDSLPLVPVPHRGLQDLKRKVAFPLPSSPLPDARAARGPGGAAIRNQRRRDRRGVLRGGRRAGCVRRAGDRFVVFREDGSDERGTWEGPHFS